MRAAALDRSCAVGAPVAESRLRYDADGGDRQAVARR
jgi:hypothetical protein